MKEHKLILLSADLREVHARLARRFNASVVHREEHGIRTPENAVRGCAEAPDNEGPEAA